jgi:aminoglycoside phosphotransferase (APT) family kinase protein
MGIIDDQAVDLAELSKRLTRWLNRQPGQAGSEVGSLRQASRVNGFSNETYRFRLSGPAGHEEELILRLPPTRVGLFPSYDIPRQYRFMHGLHEEAGLRMARCRWLEGDAQPLGRPFFIADYVSGEVAGDSPSYVKEGWIAEATAAQQRRLWNGTVDQLVQLARVRCSGELLAHVDWSDRGLPRDLQHLTYWAGLAEWGRNQLPSEDHRFADGLHDWLVQHRPGEEVSGIVWGDARFGNIIYRDFEPMALLDWELAVVGDPMLDLAYMLFHVFLMELMHGDGASTQQRFSGFGGDEHTVLHYCEQTQRSPRDYHWYWLFNAWKMLCIWECKAALLWRTGQATLDEALQVRRAVRLLPHIARVQSSGPAGAYLRP